MLAQIPQLYMYRIPISSVGICNEASALSDSLLSLCNGDNLSSFFTTDYQKFSMLTSTWKKDTQMMSSSSDIFSNDSYLQIIGMGKKALPFIFRELKKDPDHWFLALKSITGIDPVLKEDRGNINKMTEAWLNWGKDNHFVS